MNGFNTVHNFTDSIKMFNLFLKNYQKRWLNRIWPKIVEFATIVALVIVVVDYLPKWTHFEVSDTVRMLLSFIIITSFIYFFRTRLFEKSKTKEYFNPEFDFRNPEDDVTITDAVDGIFSFSKSQPYFIHVTPSNEEIKQIINAFAEGGNNFIHIHGKPGEGKSMLAYHAMYQLKKNSLCYQYALKIDALVDKNKDIIENVLNELDGLRHKRSKPSLKLILIDDAHRLPFSYELENQFRMEAKQGNGCFIWITTDLDPFDKMKKKTGELSINFQSYYMKLVDTLYKSRDSRIQKLMIDKFPKLELAIEQTKKEIIKDAWTFNFVASNGFEKMKEDVLNLKNEESYILYLLSAYTNVTGENPLLDTELFNICTKFKPDWFQVSFSEFQKYLKELSEQKPEDASNKKRRRMLRLTLDKLHNVSVESLHYLFATSYLKEVSRTLPDGRQVEILNAVKVLLDEDWRKIQYLGFFLLNIGNNSRIFFMQNAEWLKQYFEHPLESNFNQYGTVIRLLLKINMSLLTKIFTDDYFHSHTSSFSQLPVYRLSALANFIHSLPNEINSKLIMQLNISAIADTISKGTIENFGQAETLINAFGSRKDELINELIEKKKLGKIIEEISNATIENFGQTANLINVFGDRKEELLKELIEKKKLSKIIKEISNATIENFGQVEAMLSAFGDRNKELISQIDFTRINKQINEWCVSSLSLTSAIVNALGLEAVKALLPFSQDKFLTLSHQITGNQINAFNIIVSKLPNDILFVLISKVPWLELLDRIPRYSPFHFNSIARIMDYYLQSKNDVPIEKTKEPLVEYLKINREDIKKMIYNTGSKNYSVFYNSILILARIEQIEISSILKESINGLYKRFEIIPEISIYVSRLLYVFYAIEPVIAFKMILHETVKQALKDFLSSETINENPESIKSLIKAIRNSNRKLWQEEFLHDEKITLNLKSYDLPTIYKEQDDERRQMNELGLDYFKVDSVVRTETNIEVDEVGQEE